MPNHVHLAIQIAETPLSKIVQNVAFRYTRWTHRKQGRTGHLFQGRYQAILVDEDSYLLELVRYIHLNPVRAGMVANPREYRWSGHRAYVGIESLPWLETDWVLSRFAKRRKTCQQRYEAFVLAGRDEGHRSEFHRGSEDGRVLADDRFLEEILHKPVPNQPDVSLDTIVAYVSRQYAVSEEDLRGASRNRMLSEARSVVGWLSCRLKVASIKDVASYFRRDPSTFSRHVGKIDGKLKASEELQNRLSRAINAITQA
jgi:hypothetical protein